jgi:hypothetical protein
MMFHRTTRPRTTFCGFRGNIIWGNVVWGTSMVPNVCMGSKTNLHSPQEQEVIGSNPPSVLAHITFLFIIRNLICIIVASMNLSEICKCQKH